MTGTAPAINGAAMPDTAILSVDIYRIRAPWTEGDDEPPPRSGPASRPPCAAGGGRLLLSGPVGPGAGRGQSRGQQDGRRRQRRLAPPERDPDLHADGHQHRHDGGGERRDLRSDSGEYHLPAGVPHVQRPERHRDRRESASGASRRAGGVGRQRDRHIQGADQRRCDQRPRDRQPGDDHRHRADHRPVR